MSSSNKHAANEFEILSFVENGNGSKIYDVVQKQRKRKYTMEVVPRKNSTQDDTKNTRLHKHSQLKAPSCYLTQLKYSFQTKSRKYFILSHLDKERNLTKFLQSQRVLSEGVAKFLVIQFIAAIAKLHQLNISFGELNLGDVYFDTRGYVILKRTYNGQTYWTKNECYSCHRDKCKNQYHTGRSLSEMDIANDFNNIGQLFVHLITGSQHAYSILDSLDDLTKDFAYLLLRHDVSVDTIKTHPFIKDISWNYVENKEMQVPEKLRMFLIDTRQKQSSQTTDRTHSPVVERTSNNSSPSEVLVGVRKPRSKSEEPGKKQSALEKQQKERSKSYNTESEEKGFTDLHRSKSFCKSLSDSNNSVFQNSEQNLNPSTLYVRKKSIDVYQKRLEEISKVLDKNRVIVHGEDTNNNKLPSPDITINSDGTNEYLGKRDVKKKPLEFSFEKMYSENEALRTILTKYGLLKEKTNEEQTGEEGSRLNSTDEKSESPTVLSSRRRQRLRRDDKTSKMSKSCNNIQILLDNNSDDEEMQEQSRQQTYQKRLSEGSLGALFENGRKNENTKDSNHLINKLNGLSKSKTFYMRRSESASTPNSPQTIMKRHYSDSGIKPNLGYSNSPLTGDKLMSAPQALSSILKSSSSKTYLNQKQTSYDSGLNEDPIDDFREEFRRKKRHSVERNDSGLGSSQERGIRVWRPGKPESSFLEQEDKKIRATESDCFDCGASNIIEGFPNSVDHLCKPCGKSRIERKEAVVELIETEVNFGEDLQILKEEFYTPLKMNYICTTDEISILFLNLQELVDVNAKLCASLQHGLEVCIEQDDIDYMNLAVGDVFLNNVEFFEAYELYCAKQSKSTDLLKVLTKKSDLLRVFLQVSSQENVKLRKMDLKSFLTMPVQRIMKYPLLLSRIYKHTPKKNEDQKTLKEAILKVEEQIARINDISGNITTPKVKKAVSYTTLVDLDSTNSADLTKMVASMKEWKLEETMLLAQEDFEVIENELVGLTSWFKSSFKKISYLQAVICVKNAPEHYQEHLENRLQNDKAPYKLGEIKDAVIVFLKQKSIDKCLVHKINIKLKDCILSRNLNIPVAFELSETDKQPLTFVARNASTCKEWRRTIGFVIDSFKLRWRQRRGGRPNIMTEKLHLED